MYTLLRAFMRSVVSVYLFGLFRLEGAEHVPPSGGLLVCPNHPSTIDPPLVPAYLPRADSWSMAKSEYFRPGSFTGWLFTRYHAFPVVRHTPDRRALKRAMDLLRGGQVLIVYPEGRRVESPGLEAAEPGVGFLAQKLRVPVLPIALVGTRDCFPRGAHWPRRTPVSLRIGPPFRLLAERDGVRIPPQDASDAVMLSIAELLPEGARGAYGDLEALRARVGGLREYRV